MFNIKSILYLFLPFLIWGCQSMSEVGKVMRNEKTKTNDTNSLLRAFFISLEARINLSFDHIL